MLKNLFIGLSFLNTDYIYEHESPNTMSAELNSVLQTSESHFAKYADIRIHYQNKGKGGEALIFVHGWACNSTFWRAQIEAFPELRVIAIDLPGHGESDKPKVDYTIDYFARSIDAVMRDAGVNRAVLVGHSLGAIVIRHFYRQYRAKVSALVVVDGIIQQGFYNRLEQSSSQSDEDLKTKMRQTIDRMLIPVKDESVKKKIHESMLSTPDYVAMSAYKSVMDEKLYKEDPIQIPLLAILVKKPIWPENIEQSLRAFIPNLEFQMWSDVSHFLMIERSEDFNKAMKEFLPKSRIKLGGHK